jgi:transcriptional regulator with XRE-family HTH domain
MKTKDSILAHEIRMLGYTQRSLAEKLQVSYNTVCNWTKGLHNISPKYILELRELGVPDKALRNPSSLV